jgi:hypothetical protein
MNYKEISLPSSISKLRKWHPNKIPGANLNTGTLKTLPNSWA